MNTFHPASGEATRPRTARRRRAVAALLGCTTLLAGCASIPTSPSWPMVSPEPDSELPAQARIYDAKDLEAVPYDDSPAYGSLPPNGASVKENVPNILKRGRLVVGVAQSLYRLGYRDPESSDLIGFEIDLAHEIARDIFGDPDKVEFRYVESRHREDALRSGDVDLVLRTMTVTRERQKALEFSIPYLHIEERLLTLKGSGIESAADLNTKTVCASQDFPPGAVAAALEPRRIMQTRTWTDCLMAMQQGQVDAIYSDDSILSGLAAQDPDTELVGPALDEGYYAVAMAPAGKVVTPSGMASEDEDGETVTWHSEGLARQVNTTLERLRSSGQLDRLYREWLEDYMGPARDLPAKYRTPDETAALQKERDKYNQQQIHVSSNMDSDQHQAAKGGEY